MSRTITTYLLTYAPWEEHQDEPTLTDTQVETYSCDPDDVDQSDGRTAVDIAADVLRYVIEASSSGFHPGMWYVVETYVRPYTGEREEQTYHLDGFTEAEELDIATRVLPAHVLASA
jgi:hypothetical protein